MPRTRGPSMQSFWRRLGSHPARGHDGRVRAVPTTELAEWSDDPFWRHHVDPRVAERAWVSGRAAVVDGATGRPGTPGPAFSCVGPAEDLEPLMARLAQSGEVPLRVSVEAPSHPAVPDSWRHAEHWSWHWMLTRSRPDDVGDAARLVVLAEDDAGERATVEAVIGEANPGSFARPGMTRVETWLGARVGGELAGVAALLRMHDGSGHIRGVSVRPAYRGCGVGRLLSADLTRRGLANGPGVVTLGVYADNSSALAIYAGLGYELVHTFVSGPTEAGVAAGWRS